MDEFLNTAITAHARWKDQLTKAIDHGELPDPLTVRADDHCELGKWIYGDGRAYQTMLEYENLKTVHAQFHEAAANVVEKILNGDKENARADIESGTFAAATVKVIIAISKMRQERP